MSSDGTGGVSQQVTQLWSMMDDLCENDPAAYRSFIEKHMKAGAELLSAPEVDSCVRTEILVSPDCCSVTDRSRAFPVSFIHLISLHLCWTCRFVCELIVYSHVYVKIFCDPIKRRCKKCD